VQAGPIGVEWAGGDTKDNVAVRSLIRALEDITTLSQRPLIWGGNRSKDGVLIVLDEFQNLADLDTAASILRAIIESLEASRVPFVSFLLVGLEHGHDEFLRGNPSARRSFDSKRLEAMPAAESIQVLENGFHECGVTWDRELLKTRIFALGGYPHAIQIMGHNLIQLDSDANIDDADWRSALSETAEVLKVKEFCLMYRFGSPPGTEEKILNVLAVHTSEITTEVLSQKMQKIYDIADCTVTFEDLRHCGACRLRRDGKIEMRSQLLRTAILTELSEELEGDSPLAREHQRLSAQLNDGD
jgi:hypothetical protein